MEEAGLDLTNLDISACLAELSFGVLPTSESCSTPSGFQLNSGFLKHDFRKSCFFFGGGTPPNVPFVLFVWPLE